MREQPELRNELTDRDVAVFKYTERSDLKEGGYHGDAPNWTTMNPAHIKVYPWKELWGMIDGGLWLDTDEVVPIKEYIKVPVFEAAE